MITVKIMGLDRTVATLNRIKNKLPRANDRDMWNISQNLGKNLRDSMQSAGLLNFTGFLRFSSFPKKQSKGNYVIELPEWAWYQEKMKTHDVWLYDTPGRDKSMLRLWAEIRGITDSKQPNRPFRGILTVRKHPFIYKALNATKSALKQDLEGGETIKLVREGK